MNGRADTTSSLPKHSLLVRAMFALLAISALALSAQAQPPAQGSNHKQIILQHHARTHAQRQIILQHHARTHAQRQIILQHHNH
jgi:hypothetical protein